MRTAKSTQSNLGASFVEQQSLFCRRFRLLCSKTNQYISTAQCIHCYWLLLFLSFSFLTSSKVGKVNLSTDAHFIWNKFLKRTTLSDRQTNKTTIRMRQTCTKTIINVINRRTFPIWFVASSPVYVCRSVSFWKRFFPPFRLLIWWRQYCRILSIAREQSPSIQHTHAYEYIEKTNSEAHIVLPSKCKVHFEIHNRISVTALHCTVPYTVQSQG